MSALLDARAINAGYGNHTVLHAVSLRADAGEIVGLLGPNGSGKSTLLRALSGVLRPSSGTVLLRGRELASWSPRERARLVACVPQHVEVPVPFAVDELVALGRTPYVRGWTRLTHADREAVDAAIGAMDLAAIRAQSIDAVSAGERQRALLAMALAQEPDLLLLDEPTAHLDLHHAAQLMRRIHTLARERGLGVVLSSHDLALAAETCDRAVLLDRGAIAADGPPRVVLTPDRISAVYRHPLAAREEHGRWWIRAE